ncbi:MAG: TraM recognition domain-containing protein [Pseudomonadota bacterium]
MSERESSSISTFEVVCLCAAVFAIVFLPFVITSVVIGIWVGSSMVDARKSWTRFVVVLLLPALIVWYLVGPPGQAVVGTLMAVFWESIKRLVIFVLAEHNRILPPFLRHREISPLLINWFLWISLGGGYFLGLVYLFRHRPGKPRWFQRLSDRIGSALAAPWKRWADYVTQGWSLFWKRSFFVLVLFGLCGLLLTSEGYEGPIERLGAFVVMSSFLLALPRIRKDLPRGEMVWIGKDPEENPFGLSLSQLNHHVHVLGESGFGKSVLLMHVLEHHIRNGLGFIFIDLKADRRTIQRLAGVAKEEGRLEDLSVFSCASPEISATYNLCRYGNATEIKDKIIGGFVWSEPYYKKVAEEAVLTLARALVFRRNNVGTPFTLADFYNCLSSPDVTRNLASTVSQVELKNSVNRIAVRLNSEKDAQELAGLKADLGILIQSDFGHLLCSAEEGIDLFRAIQERRIVCISLESLQFGESAIRLGKMILQDLKAVAAQIMAEIPETERKHFTVVIDEFAELASPQFASFIRMARGSKIGIVMAHQEFADLEAVSPEFRDQVVGNAATTVSFLQKNPRSAELVADIAGTRSTRKVTRQVDDSSFFRRYTGAQSERDVEEYLIHPSEVKQLEIGECFVVMKYPTSASVKVRVRSLTAMREYPELVRTVPIRPVLVPPPSVLPPPPRQEQADTASLY